MSGSALFSALPLVLPSLGEIDIIKLEALRPFMKNINCKIIVLKKCKTTYALSGGSCVANSVIDDSVEEKPSKEGNILCTFKVADESGSAILTLWDEVGQCIDNGDILLIVGGFVTIFQNEIRLACKLGTVLRQGRFTMVFNEVPNHSLFCWIPDEKDPSNLVTIKISTPVCVSTSDV